MTAEIFNVARIDDVIHGRVRLGVMAYLMVEEPADFSTLKSKLGVTEGTLSVHLRKLDEAGYVAIEKTYRGRRPLTRVHLTDTGRAAFHDYVERLGRLAGFGNSGGAPP
jgi:DNA-binding MarR family transcriptional regulator